MRDVNKIKQEYFNRLQKDKKFLNIALVLVIEILVAIILVIVLIWSENRGLVLKLLAIDIVIGFAVYKYFMLVIKNKIEEMIRNDFPEGSPNRKSKWQYRVDNLTSIRNEKQKP